MSGNVSRSFFSVVCQSKRQIPFLYLLLTWRECSTVNLYCALYVFCSTITLGGGEAALYSVRRSTCLLAYSIVVRVPPLTPVYAAISREDRSASISPQKVPRGSHPASRRSDRSTRCFGSSQRRCRRFLSS